VFERLYAAALKNQATAVECAPALLALLRRDPASASPSISSNSTIPLEPHEDDFAALLDDLLWAHHENPQPPDPGGDLLARDVLRSAATLIARQRRDRRKAQLLEAFRRGDMTQAEYLQQVALISA
jgi:hypothetical protein